MKSGLIATLCLTASLVMSASTSAMAETSGAILFNGMKNDGGFNEQGVVGTERATGEVKIAIRERVTADEAETEQTLRQFADRGVQHLVTLGFANTDAVKKVAAEYPDVKFTIIDGFIPDMPNVRSVLFAEQEAGFLAGYAAGLKSQSGKVGTIGGMDIPPVRKFMCGFAAGAKAAKPDVTIAAEYAGDTPLAFRDVEGGQRIAEGMLAEGVDVIFAPAGRTAEGVAQAAQTAGAFAIMVDTNQNGFIPGTILTSATKRVDEAVYTTWKAAADGSWEPGVVTMTLAENGVDWAVDEHNEAIVSGIKAEVEGAKAALANGTMTIGAVSEIAGCADVL
ncbi:BMP family ABC transporter substrate-binding protein [Roseibium aquae]|uniref:BMP family ABC transporter substrate-binding protein n=1 Tax=Roseibium aquae TaxID=1323746 RepID=A0A916TFX2_9HYPH|nr:BMP family ABC transporter substrate-binding protein [Roseibium aquae]GGB41582.1 BMP family ABC transporter substrate-binding protein [Roseibium aquae]